MHSRGRARRRSSLRAESRTLTVSSAYPRQPRHTGAERSIVKKLILILVSSLMFACVDSPTGATTQDMICTTCGDPPPDDPVPYVWLNPGDPSIPPMHPSWMTPLATSTRSAPSSVVAGDVALAEQHESSLRFGGTGGDIGCWGDVGEYVTEINCYLYFPAQDQTLSCTWVTPGFFFCKVFSGRYR